MGKRGRLIGLVLLSAVVVFGLIGLLMNIMERRQEGQNPFFRVTEITDDTEDPAEWGKNFPLQYDGYLQTVDMERTRFGGSEAEPREPSPDDPRTETARSKLDMIPHLRRMWAGYAFSVDYREKRGHAYMLLDQTFTERQNVGQPGTCINCHASTYLPMKTLGEGDVTAGFEALNQMTWEEASTHMSGAISCIDCHDGETMQLRITRPAFSEAMTRLKASEGIENYDVNTMATRQEMRSYVCGQCHVEYYFKGEEKRLYYPWDKGLQVDSMLAYYDEVGFKDWTHGETAGPMLKAQHPEFELWAQGVHSQAGVSCADCHMPYERVGALKISNHHVRSPLLNISNSCQTCHSVAEEELLTRVETIQARTDKISHQALDALVELIDDIKAAEAGGATEAQLAEARDYQRKASFYVDFIESENSSGFHADQEAMRILAESINYSRQGQNVLRSIGSE